MNNSKLTERQKNIFIFIKTFIKEKKYPPTLQEIGDNFKITKRGALDHVKALEKKGKILRHEKISRGIIIK
jgi:repressor LexA